MPCAELRNFDRSAVVLSRSLCATGGSVKPSHCRLRLSPRGSRSSTLCTCNHRPVLRLRLTLPSRGRPQSGFACLRPPLMSNVRRQCCSARKHAAVVQRLLRTDLREAHSVLRHAPSCETPIEATFGLRILFAPVAALSNHRTAAFVCRQEARARVPFPHGTIGQFYGSA